jgi:hypothetical protein
LGWTLDSMPRSCGLAPEAGQAIDVPEAKA